MNVNLKTNNPYELGQFIKFEIMSLIKKKPGSRIICMPESAFPFALNKYPEIIEWWYSDLESKNIHILLGAHRRDKELFNTVYHLYQGKIINYYDKTNLMFFTEKVPNLWKKLSIFSDLFLKNSSEFSCGKRENVCFHIENLSVSICICSDLFLQKKIESRCNIIWFFMNDSWFAIRYINRLITSYINLRANELNKSIISINKIT